jgi:pimeloyl-ACP methyl ester carboxylesterase
VALVAGRRVLSSDGVEIAFDVAGGGRTSLLFVHGWAGRRQHWDLQREPFAERHLVVRVDLAGHGESGRGRAEWTIAAFAQDVLAVVETLDLDRVILIGHSLGGSVVVEAARLMSTRVAGLIGVDTWSALASPGRNVDLESAIPLPEMRVDFISGSARFVELMCGPTAPAQLVAQLTDEVAQMPPAIALGIFKSASAGYGNDLAEGLRALDVAVSAISSETFMPKDSVAFATYGIRNSVVKGSGHYLMLERPDDFNAELAVAISRSDPGAVRIS